MMLIIKDAKGTTLNAHMQRRKETFYAEPQEKQQEKVDISGN